MSFLILEKIKKDAKVLSILATTGIVVGFGIARFTLTETVLPTKEEITFEEGTDVVPSEMSNHNNSKSYLEEKK